MMVWFDELRIAARENASSAIVGASFDGVPVEGLATAIATRLPYRFDGTQAILSWERSLARGYGACGDAAALVVAVAERRGELGAVRLCFETVPELPTYQHVRAMWAGRVIDPWPQHSKIADGCAQVLHARSVLPARPRFGFYRSAR